MDYPRRIGKAMPFNMTRKHFTFPLMMAAGLLAVAYLALWAVGLTPASAQEREFIALLKESELAQRPPVAAVLAEARGSTYVSRRHFLAAEAAFNEVTRASP
ncbi:hypothetical protein [Hydrogenophaga sp.]|uniref:hypothetical protein n=1 Tax=Hydrogenophaga sp. TaxID=1904254 RepID=UPI002BFD636E|nr:hypothetical protein [Hydrogenophaga sp.]HMP09481.1 hypothetical protein [Hydrogenophaga sp.]